MARAPSAAPTHGPRSLAMGPSLVLGTVLLTPAAPVPADTIPTPTGPAPQIAYLRPEPNGAVYVTGYTLQRQKVARPELRIEDGKEVVKQVTEEQNVPVPFRRPFAGLDATFATADGAEVSPDAAILRAKA